MFHDDFSPERADQALLATHQHLTGYLDKLDIVTGTKALVADQDSIAGRLIDEILAEVTCAARDAEVLLAQ